MLARLPPVDGAQAGVDQGGDVLLRQAAADAQIGERAWGGLRRAGEEFGDGHRTTSRSGARVIHAQAMQRSRSPSHSLADQLGPPCVSDVLGLTVDDAAE